LPMVEPVAGVLRSMVGDHLTPVAGDN
jgi:hypothetical protein